MARAREVDRRRWTARVEGALGIHAERARAQRENEEKERRRVGANGETLDGASVRSMWRRY
jgi:hypothetical protein